MLPYTCSDCGERHNRRRITTSKCGTISWIHKQSKCAPCHAAYVRQSRKNYQDLSPEEKKKANCRSHTKMLLRRGTLAREPCVECGHEPAEAHHPDYDDPRNVMWLCLKHHRRLHAAQ